MTQAKVELVDLTFTPGVLSSNQSWIGINTYTQFPVFPASIGSVFFAGSGGTVSQSANLIWDNTDKWLGVGGNPSAPLDGKGVGDTTAYIVARLNSGTSGYAAMIQFTDNTNYAQGFGTDTTGAWTWRTGVFNGAAGTERMHLSTSGVISMSSWGGAVIGSSFGGAGSVNGIMKANGAGTVSAAVSGTDYAGAPVTKGDLLAQSTSVSSVMTAYNTPNDATTHTYRVNAYTAITAISAGTLTVQVSFTDENNTSRTISYFAMGLTSAGLTTTGFDSFPPAVIRCKPNTAITVLTTFTGVSITYDVGAFAEFIY